MATEEEDSKAAALKFPDTVRVKFYYQGKEGWSSVENPKGILLRRCNKPNTDDVRIAKLIQDTAEPSSIQWAPGRTEAAKDLIASMLVKDPKNRFTVANVLNYLDGRWSGRD